MTRDKHVFIFVGERSGDLIGADISRELKAANTSIEISAVAGPLMRQHITTCVERMEAFAMMGVAEILLNLPQVVRLFQKIKNYILETRPEIVLLIDYAEWNMRMAKSLRNEGYTGKIGQVVCPSIWAWRRGRKNILEKTLDYVFCLFPFEPELFDPQKLEAIYVGHPLVQKIAKYPYDKRLPKNLPPLITLFPGSRQKEVERNLPVQLQAAAQFCQKHPDFSIACSLSSPNFRFLVENACTPHPFDVMIFSHEYNYDIMRKTHIAIATSGTINLELALHLVPTVTTYAMSKFDLFLGKYIFQIRLPYYCIVNILLQQKTFPECYGDAARSSRVFEELENLEVPLQRKECIERCRQIQSRLGNPFAAKKIIEKIL